MSEELRPCPFCGGEPHASYGVVSCRNEECIANAANDEPTIGLIEAWNTRPIEDELRARIAELEAAQRWIPVSERLPEIEDGDSKDYDVVLTYPFRRDVIVATWSYDALDKTHRRRWFDCSSDEWGSDDITEYVTHWRERPAPPEVQESEATSCKFCGSNKSDIRMGSIVCTSCGRKIGNIAPPEVEE